MIKKLMFAWVLFWGIGGNIPIAQGNIDWRPLYEWCSQITKFHPDKEPAVIQLQEMVKVLDPEGESLLVFQRALSKDPLIIKDSFVELEGEDSSSVSSPKTSLPRLFLRHYGPYLENSPEETLRTRLFHWESCQHKDIQKFSSSFPKTIDTATLLHHDKVLTTYEALLPTYLFSHLPAVFGHTLHIQLYERGMPIDKIALLKTMLDGVSKEDLCAREKTLETWKANQLSKAFSREGTLYSVLLELINLGSDYDDKREVLSSSSDDIPIASDTDPEAEFSMENHPPTGAKLEEDAQSAIKIQRSISDNPVYSPISALSDSLEETDSEDETQGIGVCASQHSHSCAPNGVLPPTKDIAMHSAKVGGGFYAVNGPIDDQGHLAFEPNPELSPAEGEHFP